ncbi:MAG: glycoside hydrolase family 3 C-terminal domain-containing protein [Bacilli bacterium]|nr:glycoside hydrolase family 3 C-terminal domain-containing protein [Bacilli bacterium]
MKNSIRKNVFSGVFLALIAAGGVGLGIGNHLAFDTYKNAISNALCPTGEDDTAEAAAARNMGNQLAKEIEREGIVLLQNKDNCLPLDKNSVSKVNVFGHGSIDWYYMSSGSERVGMDGQTSYDLNGALAHYGIEVNEELPTYYKKWHRAEGDSNTIMAQYDSFYQIREPGWKNPNGSDNTEYQGIFERAKAYSNTALFVISRHAGENSDPPHYQTKVEGQPTDNDRGYLEISTEEEDMLKRVAENFDNVIVVINSTNTMTLDFIEKIDNVNACISVGATGVQGALAIPEILYGEDHDGVKVSPSGHVTDTVAYRPEYAYNYFNSCALHTRHYTGGKSASLKTMGAGGNKFYQYSCYVEYSEGIYVGYRWYETADAEGYWDSDIFKNNWDNDWKEKYNVSEMGGYNTVVQYPFGFGQSYTTFDWKLVETSVPVGSAITNKDKITLSVEVENTGNYPGKDVVQVYLNQPYTPGGIEKSYVKLVAYAKSPNLQPGQKAKLDIEVECSNFKSYDDYDKNENGFCGYEMEAGDYTLRLQTDAHNLKEMSDGNNEIKYVVNKDLQIDEDEWTEATVENRFTGDTAYMGVPIDGSSVDQNVQYIHRDEFLTLPLPKECPEDKPWTDKLLNRKVKDGDTVHDIVVSSSCFSREMADLWDNADYDYFGNPVNKGLPTWGASGDLKLMENGQLTELGQELGNNYDDPRWDELLDQVPLNHAVHYLTMDTQYKAPGIAAIGLRTNDDGAFQHGEGASQVGNGAMVQGTSNVGYPASTVLAQTFNQTLAFLFGKSEGNDMGPAGKDALYSPAMNIHRSTYGGRNSGYQSEDPYLSGRQCANVVRGLGVYGKTTFLKHFALNDQDFNRMGLYTWTTEQTLREIYIRSFEEVIKYGDSTAVMTSFNRVGNIWAGGNEALLQGILRYEWGFKGQVITDMTENETNMDGSFNLRCGGNINLGGQSTHTGADLGSSSTARVQNRMREAIKEIAYSYTHALYKNWSYNEAADPADAVIVSEPKYSWQWWEPALVSFDAFAIGGLGIGFVAVLDKGFNLFSFLKKKEEL